MEAAEIWWARLSPGEKELWIEEALTAFPPGPTPPPPQACFQLYCERGRQLSAGDLDHVSSGTCPHCYGRGFVIGPMGGAMLNIECAQPTCRDRFNVLFFSGRAMMAHELPNGFTSEPWPSEPKPG